LGKRELYLIFAACFSTKSDGKLASLDEYISRMKSGQKDIFYITGSSKEQLEKSPFLERLTKKNYEVFYAAGGLSTSIIVSEIWNTACGK
jgi:HSP90 family molecular chaperone